MNGIAKKTQESLVVRQEACELGGFRVGNQNAAVRPPGGLQPGIFDLEERSGVLGVQHDHAGIQNLLVVFDEMRGAGMTVVMRPGGDEDVIVPRRPFPRRNVPGQRQQGGDAAGIVVGAVKVGVMMGRDDDVIVVTARLALSAEAVRGPAAAVHALLPDVQDEGQAPVAARGPRAMPAVSVADRRTLEILRVVRPATARRPPRPSQPLEALNKPDRVS